MPGLREQHPAEHLVLATHGILMLRQPRLPLSRCLHPSGTMASQRRSSIMIAPMTEQDHACRRAIDLRCRALIQQGICPTCQQFTTGDVYPGQADKIYYEDEHAVGLLETYPRGSGHTIIISKVHEGLRGHNVFRGLEPPPCSADSATSGRADGGTGLCQRTWRAHQLPWGTRRVGGEGAQIIAGVHLTRPRGT